MNSSLMSETDWVCDHPLGDRSARLDGERGRGAAGGTVGTTMGVSTRVCLCLSSLSFVCIVFWDQFLIWGEREMGRVIMVAQAI